MVGGGGMGPKILSIANPKDNMRPSSPGGAEICKPAGVPVLSKPIGNASAAIQPSGEVCSCVTRNPSFKLPCQDTLTVHAGTAAAGSCKVQLRFADICIAPHMQAHATLKMMHLVAYQWQLRLNQLYRTRCRFGRPCHCQIEQQAQKHQGPCKHKDSSAN